METITSLKNKIQENKEYLYKVAKENTKVNEAGFPTISKDDPWFYEDEWDEHYKRISDKM